MSERDRENGWKQQIAMRICMKSGTEQKTDRESESLKETIVQCGRSLNNFSVAYKWLEAVKWFFIQNKSDCHIEYFVCCFIEFPWTIAHNFALCDSLKLCSLPLFSHHHRAADYQLNILGHAHQHASARVTPIHIYNGKFWLSNIG